ncbi:MAG: hypothetical protein Q8K61_10565 [Gallionella sp.]|nr:hypothetical protein [Gallionella sp.]
MKEPKEYLVYEQEILAAVGELLVSKLEGHDDLARVIFDELAPKFLNRYPYHKILTHIIFQHTKEETPEEMEIRLRSRMHPEALRLLEMFEGSKR